jgi:hypothetical protein
LDVNPLLVQTIKECLQFSPEDRPCINHLLRAEMFSIPSSKNILYQKRVSVSQPPVPKVFGVAAPVHLEKEFSKVKTDKVRKFVSPPPLNSKPLMQGRLNKSIEGRHLPRVISRVRSPCRTLPLSRAVNESHNAQKDKKEIMRHRVFLLLGPLTGSCSTKSVQRHHSPSNSFWTKNSQLN